MSLAASLRLFRAIQVEHSAASSVDPEMLRTTLAQGYILDPAIAASNELVRAVTAEIGLSSQEINATFHKSWEKIKSASIEQLVLEQMLHYLTTYGHQQLGIFDRSIVYIPKEQLDVPSLTEDVPITYIRALSAEEIQCEIVKLGNGVALNDSTLDNIMEIVAANQFSSEYLPDIRNHELSARLYVHYDLVPDVPTDYLRYLIYRTTGQSLLIKNDALIELIKSIDKKHEILLNELLERAPSNLGNIFYRFKPIFLALKTVSKNKTFFNRLRKQAVKIHQPLATDYLGSVTQQIMENRINLDELSESLDKASVFRATRLAYALEYRLQNNRSIVYPVRNGKGWKPYTLWATVQ